MACLGACARANDNQGDKEDQGKKLIEINYLLDLVEHSPLSFERNGQKASGKDAAKLLRYKLNQDKNKIHTTEDFIEIVASYSSHTKKSYNVFLSDEKKIKLKDMLYTELNKFRKRSKGKAA